MQISTEFVCGRGQDLVELDTEDYSLVIPPDPPSVSAAKGYDYYFCVRLTSNSPQPRTVTLNAVRPGHVSRNARWYSSRTPIFISEDFQAWYVLDQVEASQNHEEYRATVPLYSGQSVYLSNSLPYPHKHMAAGLRRIQVKHDGLAQLFNIGRSVEGRDILLLSITDPAVDDSSKDRVLITSGFHPAEPDWLATTTIIETLLSDDGWAKQIRQEFIVDIVVQVNPDGFDLGTNACNAHGINLYWDFRPQEPKTSPEAVHLWRWIETHPPCLYIDFHAYVHQLHKDFRPYIRPLSDYALSARPVVRAIDQRLVALCNRRSAQGPITNLSTTLAAQITDAFGTITYAKFHLHLQHGIRACQQLGVGVFKTIVDTARAYRPLTPKVIPRDDKRRSFADYWLHWWEQSRTALRMGSLWRRVRDRLAMSNPTTNGLLSALPEKGLATHWRRHLWSDRPNCEPVVRVTGADGTVEAEG